MLFQAEQFGVIQGSAYQRIDGQIVVGGDGIPLPDQGISIIGNPNPNYTANWINTLGWKGLSFDFHWQYIDGGDISSFTAGTMLARGVTTDTDVNRFLPLVFPGVLEDGTPNDIQAYIW